MKLNFLRDLNESLDRESGTIKSVGVATVGTSRAARDPTLIWLAIDQGSFSCSGKVPHLPSASM